MKSIAVYCGSRSGALEVYKEGAVQLGKEMAKRGITLIYGGSTAGIMGIVADTVLKEGGKAIGVIPSFLGEYERFHNGLTELMIVNNMHERKSKMMELADGYIAMPGGAGTLEELFEVFTWSQIGLHQKPCGILNIHRYYDLLIDFMDHMCEQQFLTAQHRNGLLIDSDPAGLLEKFATYR